MNPGGGGKTAEIANVMGKSFILPQHSIHT